MSEDITARQRQILVVIEEHQRTRGFPPSVREIGEAVGLTSPSSVHAHLATLQRLGYLVRDPTKPRAIEVRWDPNSGAAVDIRIASERAKFGELFVLRVRGDSMIDAGILDGDYVVCRSEPTASKGTIVVAGIPGEEATVKTLGSTAGGHVVLEPANQALEPMRFPADEVQIFGVVVTVLRKL